MAKRKVSCMRCMIEFPSWNALVEHSKQHIKKPAVIEIKLLQQGKVPESNKIGQGFKGKNKVIVS